jgi:dTDP-4-amino-4,6-dideoxygalactose transaminase
MLYNEAFKNLDFLQTPKTNKGDADVWHQYVVRSSYRDALQAHLNASGIGTMVHYPIPNHQQGAYKDQNFSAYDLADYEKLVGSILSLPIDTFITDSEVQLVIDAVKLFKH